MGLRDRIERGFERWAHGIYRRPRRVGIAVLAGALALASQLPRLEFETALEEFLRDDDPLRVEYDAFRRQFGRDDLLLLGVEGPDVFAADYLEGLRALHRDLEAEVPHLNEVTSLWNARETRGEGDRLVVGELLERWPESDVEREAVRARALASRLYRNLLLAADARLSVVTVELDALSEAPRDVEAALAGFEAEPGAGAPRRFLSGAEMTRTVRAVEAVVARHARPDFQIWIVGAPALQVFLQEAMQRDMLRFTALGLGVIALGLALLFRRVAGVVLPLVVVTLSLLCTLGLLAALGQPVNLTTAILPSFLLAVGVGYSVHVLAIFFQRRQAGADEETAIAGALGHTGLPVVLTALTTAGALASFAAAPLQPVAALGQAAPAGVLIACALSLTLLPALVALLPVGEFPARLPVRTVAGERPLPDASRRALVRCGRFGVRHAGAVLLAGLGVLAVSLLGAAQIRTGHDPMSWLPEDDPYRLGTARVDERLGGSIFLELLIDTGRENGLHDPALLARLDALRREIESRAQGGVHVGKTLSIVDVLKEIHQALHGGAPEAWRLPGERALVAQELLLFESAGSDDLEDVADPAFRVGRLTLKTPFVDATAYPPYLEALGALARERLGEGVAVGDTGMLVILSGTIEAVIESLVASYAIALVVIALLMVLLIGELRLGLLSMLPNLAPIVLTLGVMGVAGIPLDAFTLLIGSIAIGLAVDDTIHFMHHFRRYRDETGDVEQAVERTLATAGQAMLFTTGVLCAGFLTFTLASLHNLFYFGLLTALTVAVALLADLLLAPALVAVFGRVRPGA